MEASSEMADKRVAQILIFGMLFIVGAYFFHPVEYDNTASRYFLMSSIVDHGTFHIDRYQERTLDKSYAGGHYFSNKAIGASLLGVPVYWMLRQIPVPKAPPLNSMEKYVVRLVTTTLPFALLGIILFRTALLLGTSPQKALWIVMAYSFGSIAVIHATLFSGHQSAAGFSFFSFFILFRLSRSIDREGKQPNQYLSSAFFSGLFAGLAMLNDYTAVFIVFVLCAYALSSCLKWHQKMLYLSGIMLCILVLAAYNWKCFGSPWSLSYDHLTLKEFREGSAKGFWGISIPDINALISITLSPSRGLFFIMPVFLFSLTGFWAMWQQEKWRREAIVFITIAVGYLLINAGFYGWHGGWTFGPRYLVPMLPFLVLPMVFSPWESKWFLILFGLSVFQVFWGVAGFPHVPQEIKNPIMEIILPCMGYGYMAQNPGKWLGLDGIGTVLPVLLVVLIASVYAFRKLSGDSKSGHLSLKLKAILLLWVCFIIVMLGVHKTIPPKPVSFFRSRLLTDAAAATGSEKLLKTAIYESRLSNLQ